MYFRQFKEAPAKLIKNGKAAFGCYNGVSPKIDIRGMRAPYAGVPLPSFLSDLRIKSRLSYLFNINKYIGYADFFDFKVIGLAQIIFWNKETSKKCVYHAIMPPRRRFVPTETTRGICASYRKSRYIKISWGRSHKHHALSFKVKGDGARPDAEGYFYSSVKDEIHTDSFFVTPSPASSRASATWISTMKILGHIALNNGQTDDSEGLASMVMNRTYYNMHSKTVNVCGIGKLNEQNIVFQLKSSNMDAADSDTYNENILVVNSEITPLPPVYITHPFGMNDRWIIQDTESMVDLTFTPQSVDNRILNLIAMRTDSTSIYGTFEGTLLTKDGGKIPLKGFPGLLCRNQLRII